MNTSGNIVGIQTLYPLDSFHSFQVMSAEPLKDAIKAKKKKLNAAKSTAKSAAEQRTELDGLECVLISASNLLYKEVHALSIHIPKSEIKLAIHVKYLHDKLKYFLEQAGGGLNGQGLDKALENHYIRSSSSTAAGSSHAAGSST